MMPHEREKAAIFLCHYSIGKSSPVICFLEWLCDYYSVDLHLYNVGYLNAKVMQRINHVIQYPTKMDITAIQESSSVSYDHYIAIDANGFALCKTLFPASSPIYYSLELYFRDNAYNLHYPTHIMELERSWINTIKGLIIQSEERESLFRNEYGLSPAIPTFLLPITYMQPSNRKRSDYLRQKLNVPGSRKIALHLGGIQEQHCLMEIAAAFQDVPDWALVMHGNAFGDYKKNLENFINQQKLSNVYLSDDYIEQIEDLDVILESADAGIAWYKDVSPNFTSAGKSSGKISAYLRFGLPVIANSYKSTLEALEDRGCGVCVERFEQIPAALRNVAASYRYYSENAFKEYDAVYWFENYREPLKEFIEPGPRHITGSLGNKSLFTDPSLSVETMDIFWIRKSILAALRSYLAGCRGILLDVGCGEMPYKQLIASYPGITRYIGLDIENPHYQANSKPDLFWDGTSIPLPENSVDCAIATELFEHIPNLEATLTEIKRVLKPGGQLFFTVPFLWPLHDMPRDEYRYTPFALKRIFLNTGYAEIDIAALGGWDASLAQMIGLWLRRRPMSSDERTGFQQFLLPFYQELLRFEHASGQLSFEDMSKQSSMITGLSGRAVKSVPDAVECPVCGGRFAKFLPYGTTPRSNALCPSCNSLERHRLLWLFLRAKTDLWVRNLKLLDIAPYGLVSENIKKMANIDYLSIDINSPQAMLQMDITNLGFQDNSFDSILCYHVLEHVPNEQKAMQELFRVLKPGGWAIIQVPLKPGPTMEGAHIYDPVERKRLFGQEDHVRYYGDDFKSRLEHHGFVVTVDPFASTLSQADLKHYAISVFEDIYYCTKPK
ncbi:MAG: hypothetical protein CXR30_11530 [Geobacter sp.]|nr:MAG: hypothetical protein CXR30_11530 [Geobacter sp.]